MIIRDIVLYDQNGYALCSERVLPRTPEDLLSVLHVPVQGRGLTQVEVESITPVLKSPPDVSHLCTQPLGLQQVECRVGGRTHVEPEYLLEAECALLSIVGGVLGGGCVNTIVYLIERCLRKVVRQFNTNFILLVLVERVIL